ncbi:MAG: hypothetical protein U0326_36000 [Polyangiales bacterium]
MRFVPGIARISEEIVTRARAHLAGCRTTAGITWQAEFLPGATTPALDLVTRGESWSLAAPFRPPAPGPDLGGSIETLDVSWRGERLWVLLTGPLSTVAGPMPLREAYDCERAP